MANISSPDFPTSILAAIFSFVCGSGAVFLPFRAKDERGILRLVSRSWDVLVRSTNTLWNDIHFAPPLSFYTPPEDLLKQFTACTIRSGANPLKITFDMGLHDWSFSIVNSVVIPNVHRIQKLTCPIHTNYDIIAFLTIPEGQFSVLESLDVCFINTWTDPISRFSPEVCIEFNALRTAPLLRSVTAHLVNGLHPINLFLPWNQITSIDFGTVAMPPEVFVKIIRYGSLQLQEAFFHIRFSKLSSPHAILTPHKITLCKLRKLRLRVIYPKRDKRLFSILHLPALTHLHIEMHDIYQDWNISIYIKLLFASASTLQQLRLSDFPPSEPNNQLGYSIRKRQCTKAPNTLENLFKAIPNATSVYLPLGLYIHASTVEKLASCNLLPKLHLLEVAASIASGWHLLSMVERRHEHVLNASLGLGSSSEIPHTAPQPASIRYLSLFLPHHQCTVHEETALSQQQRFLASLGIMVPIEPTVDLPLPIMD